MKKLPRIVLTIIGSVIGFFVVICVLGMALGALGSSGSNKSTELPPTQVQATSKPNPTNPPATAKPAEQSRCVLASQGQIDRIRSGVKAVDANNDIREVWAVKSNDFKSVWFVTAKIYGTGMENGSPEAGVWAINGDPDNPGITMSVDGFAKAFSDWPDGSTTDAKTSMQDDGALEAKACAQR